MKTRFAIHDRSWNICYYAQPDCMSRDHTHPVHTKRVSHAPPLCGRCQVILISNQLQCKTLKATVKHNPTVSIFENVLAVNVTKFDDIHCTGGAYCHQKVDGQKVTRIAERIDAERLGQIMEVLFVYISQTVIGIFDSIDPVVHLLVSIVFQTHGLHLNCFSNIIIHRWVTMPERLVRRKIYAETK